MFLSVLRSRHRNGRRRFVCVYNETNGLDGYVSLEVSPYLAYDSQGTIEEAERLGLKLLAKM